MSCNFKSNTSACCDLCQVNDDLNERLKAKGIKVVANVGFKSDPAEALYILKVKSLITQDKVF